MLDRVALAILLVFSFPDLTKLAPFRSLGLSLRQLDFSTILVKDFSMLYLCSSLL